MLSAKWLINNHIDRYFKDVTNSKIPSFLYIDDRTICFKGDFEKNIRRNNKFQTILERLIYILIFKLLGAPVGI